MTFLRLKTDSAGRVYLYEETRTREGGKVKSKSRSQGRVHGFWFAMACLIDDMFTKTHGYDPDEAERQMNEKMDREDAAAAQRLRDVVNPTTYDAKPAVNAVPQDFPAAPQPTPDTTPDVPAPDHGAFPEPGQSSSAEPGAASE